MMNRPLIHQCICAAFGYILLTGCYRQEIHSFTVHVPQLRSEACGKIITDQLLNVEGVKSATVNIPEKQISVVYLSTKIAEKNIEFVVSGTGFDANDRPGSASAREKLPEDCR